MRASVFTIYHFSQLGYHSHLKILQDSLELESCRDMGNLSTTKGSCRYKIYKTEINRSDAITTALDEEIWEIKIKHVLEAVG